MFKRFKNAIFDYFQESYQELRKVTWPTRNQAIRLTFIVLGFCLVAAILMGALDLAFNTGYRELVDYAAKVAPPTTPIETPVTPETPNLQVVTNEATPQVSTEATTQSGSTQQ